MSHDEEGSRLQQLLAKGLFGWEIFRIAIATIRHPLGGSVATSPESDKPEPRSGREADVRKPASSSERLGTALVVLTFLVAVAGGLGFLFAYWSNADDLLMGISLAGFCGGVGCTLIFWARRLMWKGEATEAREQLASPTEEQEALFETARQSADQVRRRGLLKSMAILGAGLSAAIMVSMLRSLGMFPESRIFDTVWSRGQRLVTIDHKVLSVDSLDVGSTAIVFPEDKVGDERGQTVLVRVPVNYLHMPDGRNDWAPMGYIAYSRVCTHAGCPVGMYEATTCTLLCPCHQSSFDVLRAAEPTGGPAARALPQLPLYVDRDGTLRAGGGFTEPPGPGFWSIQL